MQSIEEPHVFTVYEQIDEATDLTVFVDDAVADAGKLLFEVKNQVLEGLTSCFHDIAIGCQGTQRSRDAHGNAHQRSSIRSRACPIDRD